MGRVSIPREKSKDGNFTLYLSEHTHKCLENLSIEFDISKAEAIRIALRIFMYAKKHRDKEGKIKVSDNQGNLVEIFIS